jgi:alkylated DNA repair dioxygenase AlkB
MSTLDLCDVAHTTDLALNEPALDYIPHFLSDEQSAAYFLQLSDPGLIAWRQDEIRIAGKCIPIPRLNAWYGDAGADYSYSNIRLKTLPWVEPLSGLKARVESAAKTRFNSVLLNLYRDENDSVSWHADDEPELGPDPVIASLSLGAARVFELRPKRKRTPHQSRKILLEHGSLLVMGSGVQCDWEHRLPKARYPMEVRINLTFRYIV